MKTILLTGGSGFIGKNLLEYYKNSNEYVILAPSSKELNCINQHEVYNYLTNNKIDYVLNFAVYGDGIDKSKDATKMLEYNLRMYLNFACCSNLYERMIYLGSGAEYNKQYPICEVSEEDIDNNIPSDQYGLMKYTVNKLIEKSDNIYNFRLFGIFGKYEPLKRFISNICCKSIVGLPLSMRQNVYFDYLYIDDFLKILDKFLKLDNPKFHTYNIVSGKKIDLASLCSILDKITEKKHDVFVCNEGLGNEYSASNNRINEEIDIEYTDIEDSVACMYKYYSNNRDVIKLNDLIY